MSSLQDLIKKIQVGEVSTNSYVYYDKDTGKIHKISSTNVLDDVYSVIAIPQEEVKSILTGGKRTEEFVIVYDLSLKQIRLKEVAYDDNHKTASTMCYRLPVIKNSHDSHFVLEHIYDGVDVYIHDLSCNYTKGQCVWYKNNVYKLKIDIEADGKFDAATHSLFIENVLLTDLPTQTQSTEKMSITPEYKNIHIDVWYKELSHLAGQHVWLNRTVYKLVNDQPANTEFTMDNVDIIVDNVKLYADENKALKTNQNVTSGDIILDNNKLYRIKSELEEFNKDKTSIFFFTTANTMVYYTDENVVEVDLFSETITYKDKIIKLFKSNNLKNGQTILSGKQLYQLQVDKEYDIIVQQNTQHKYWSILLNPYTKKFLLNSGYNPEEILYFSVTSKYDPNVLYRSLEFKVGDLLSNNTSIILFMNEIEQSIDSVSIYTAKYFDSYAHETI